MFNSLLKIYEGIAVLVDKYIVQSLYKKNLGYCGRNVTLRYLKRLSPSVLSRMYLGDNVLMKGFDIISFSGKFIMKSNSCSAIGLTIITGNHKREKGNFLVSDSFNHKLNIECDVIVEEDVWIGANVTLLSGVTIGRGATIGACSVCVKSVPPYAIVMGNPAKVVGFNYRPNEIVEHEKVLYPEEERLSLDLLEKNYNKYFLKRIKEIKEFTRI